MSLGHLESCFPVLITSPYKKTSEKTDEYNCIAWAAGETDARWWPMKGYYWPPLLTKGSDNLATFQQGFATLGYEVCADGKLEAGWEKVAFYTIDGHVKHAARQLENGRWTSKCGGWEDIERNLDGLTGRFHTNSYGFPTHYMKRPRSSGPVA